jgi:hypothetical protein
VKPGVERCLQFGRKVGSGHFVLSCPAKAAHPVFRDGRE